MYQGVHRVEARPVAHEAQLVGVRLVGGMAGEPIGRIEPNIGPLRVEGRGGGGRERGGGGEGGVRGW